MSKNIFIQKFIYLSIIYYFSYNYSNNFSNKLKDMEKTLNSETEQEESRNVRHRNLFTDRNLLLTTARKK